MALTQLERSNFGDYQSNKMQFNNLNFSRQLESCPLLTGNHVRELQFLNTSASPLTQDVGHGLGRKPIGFIITKINAPRVVYLSSTDNKYYNEQTIRLTASASSTFDVWFF